MLDLMQFNPAWIMPTVTGATMALGLSAVAQRLPRCWGGGGRSQAVQPPAQAVAPAPAGDTLSCGASGADQHPRPARSPPEAERRCREEPLPREIARWQQEHAQGRRRIATPKAGLMLIQFMQAQGATGYFTVKEIDAWWRYMRQEEGLDYLSGTVVRSELSGFRNVWIGLKRLNAPEYREVKARNEGLERAVLYKIPSPRSMSGTGAGLVPEESWLEREETGVKSGKRPANPKKRVLSGADSWSAEHIASDPAMRRAA